MTNQIQAFDLRVAKSRTDKSTNRYGSFGALLAVNMERLWLASPCPRL